MNNKVKNHSVISPPPPPPRVQVGYSHLLLRLFLGVVLFISFSRCGGGGDALEPDVKSKEASISKISFTVNGKNYEASISEMEVTVNLPHGTTIPSQVTITILEYASKAVSSVQQGEILTVSNGKATITITAEDDTTTKTYTINFVNLPPSTEATISKLSFMVNGKNYDTTISEGEVTVNLPNGSTIPSEVTITTLEHAPKAVSSVQQGETLTVSNGKATITITAEDETTTKTYTINFIILPSSEAFISSLVLEVKGEAKTIDFDQDGNAQIDFPYGATIPSEVTITTLEYAPKAVSSVQQGEILTVSNGKATITITAEDDTTTKTYTINFVREVRVTFNVNDDITAIPSLDLKKGSKASKPATDPMPASGKSFGYWTAVMGSTPANYGKDLFDFDTTPINEDITLYAVWQEKPETKTALITLINQAINDQGNSPNLNFIDTGLITDMKELFKDKGSFNGDVSGWDTSKVTTMVGIFQSARVFNGDISNWDTSEVTTMEAMFSDAYDFNQDIGNWDTGEVTTMEAMFNYAYDFNQDIGNWNTAKVTNMSWMFYSAQKFNQDIRDWNTAKVINMFKMFQFAYVFNGDIGNWNTAKVTNMKQMFESAYDFDRDISGWIVAQVTSYSDIFKKCGIREEYKPTRFRTNDGN